MSQPAISTRVSRKSPMTDSAFRSGVPWRLIGTWLCCLVSAATLSAAQGEGIENYVFDNGASSDWTGFEIQNGQAVLTNKSSKKNRGKFAMLKQSLPMPEEGQRLSVDLRILGMSNADDGPLDASARMFFAPAPMPKWKEPYSLSHTLWLYLTYKHDRPEHITLFRKAGEKHFGKRLYSAKLTNDDIPLRISLEFGRETYRLSFDRELQGTGALSGKHGLDSEQWKDRVRFGARAVNNRGGVRTQLLLDDIDFALVGRRTRRQQVSAAEAAGRVHETGEKLDPISVLIQPEFTRRVQEMDRVPRAFGVTVNGQSRGEAVDMVRALNLNSARTFLWALGNWKRPNVDFEPKPVTPGRVQQYGHKGGLSPSGSRRQYDKFFDQHLHSLMKTWWEQTDRRGRQSFQAELFERWGLTDGLIFHTGTPDDGVLVDYPEGVNRFFSAYIEMLRHYHPDLDITFVQLSNEPNYAHFTWSLDSQRAVSRA